MSTEGRSSPCPPYQRYDRIKLAHFEGTKRIVHSKYLLVEGTYAGHRNSKWVFTGSHNLDEASLSRNDETLLRLQSDSLYDAYATNFRTMWNAGVHD